MRINKLYITKYKNLKDIQLDFTEGNMVSIFIGNNGSGKSNLIEAIILAFKGVYLGGKPLFEFTLEYTLSNKKKIYIQSKADKYSIKIDEENYTFNRFRSLIKDDSQSYFPENILAYYSGHTTRLSNIFDFAEDGYIKNLSDGFFKKRHFFFLKPIYFPMLLLSTFGSELSDIKDYLSKTLKVRDLETFTIKLDAKKVKSLRGILNSFVSILLKASCENQETDGELILKFKGMSALKDIIDNDFIGYDRDLFKFLDAAYITGLLKGITLDILLNNGELINDGDLSEGEQQSLIINAIVEFFGYKDTLYLLDEPDTFFHPEWQREYVKILRNTGAETQFLVTTHSPLMLSNLDENSIFVMGEGQVYTPSTNGSLGRDVNAILNEIMEVSERPKEIMDLIMNFHDQITFKNKDNAKDILRKLTDMISPRDPFITEAKSLLMRLEAIGK